MTREELLQIAKPVLFNTEMTVAILDGRKTVTRRCVKYKYSNTEMKMHTDKYGTRLIEIQKDVEGETHGRNLDGSTWQKLLPYIEKESQYRRGDILYVRETWSEWTGGYVYKAWSGPFPQSGKASVMKWHPSIHMPKEAARIFLRVTDVRAERLQDICGRGTPQDHVTNIAREGLQLQAVMENYQKQIDDFKQLWNSTIKKSDIPLYGWDANPWVWVIEFERIAAEQ